MQEAACPQHFADEKGIAGTASNGGATILLVEDETAVLKLVASVLRGWGYQVLEAPHAEMAMRIGQDHQGPIHLMLSDVVMPQLSGPQLADRLRPLRPDMSVIFMSGYCEVSSRYSHEDERSWPLLTKPFDLQEMRQQIWQLLASSP